MDECEATYDESKVLTANKQKEFSNQLYSTKVFPKEICNLIGEYVVIPKQFMLPVEGIVLCLYEHQHFGVLIFTSGTALHIYSENNKWQLIKSLWKNNAPQTATVWCDRLFTVVDERLTCLNIQNQNHVEWFIEVICCGSKSPNFSQVYDLLVSYDILYFWGIHYLTLYKLSIQEKTGHCLLEVNKSIYFSSNYTLVSSHPCRNKLYMYKVYDKKQNGVFILDTESERFSIFLKTDKLLNATYSDQFFYFREDIDGDEKNYLINALNPITGQVLKSLNRPKDPCDFYAGFFGGTHNYLFVDTHKNLQVIHLSCFNEK